jgi:hypothetical protein
VEAAARNPVTAKTRATDTNAAGTFMVTLTFLDLRFEDYLNYRLNLGILKPETQAARNRLYLVKH